MGAEVNMEDILNMFGMGGGIPGMGGMPGMGRGSRKMRRSPDEQQKYEVSLEDLYKGKTVRFSSTKNVICSLCKGSGGKEKATAKECSTCKGQGFRQVVRQVGPGMITQQTVECNICEGTGSVYNPKDKCKKCKGKKLTEEKKQLEVYIPRGGKEGDKVRLEGEADQVPGTQETGDIIFNALERTCPPNSRLPWPRPSQVSNVSYLSILMAEVSKLIIRMQKARSFGPTSS